MATQTQVRRTKPRSRKQRVGKTANIPTAPAKKPKTFKQWAGKRGSKWMDGHWFTRGVRRGYRFGRREAEGIRRRRADNRAGKPHSMPTRRAILARKMRRGRAKVRSGMRKVLGLDQLTRCMGCGQNFTNARQYHAHPCAQNHGPKASAPAKTKPAKAAQPPPAAPSSGSAPAKPANAGTAAAAAGGAALGNALAAAAKGKVGTSNATAPTPAVPAAQQQMPPMAAKAQARVKGRRWRERNKAQRKAAMTRRSRMADRIGREARAAIGDGARCVQCGWAIRQGEYHNCQEDPNAKRAQQGPDPATGAQAPPTNAQPAPTKTPKTPAPPTTPPNSTPKAPTAAPGGTTTGKGAAMTAPAAAPSTNGSAPSPSGNSSGGPGPGLAATIEQAWAAWCQDIPEFHDDMIVKMNATREMMGRVATMIQDHASQLVAAEFHPECVTPLLSASAQTLETANHFTNVLMAIERIYAGPLAHYRSGIPDPGEKYLSSGRKGTN